MTDKLQEVQEGVEMVKVLMVENVNKVDERGDKLQDLEERSAKLLNSSASFHKQSKKIRVKKERENLRSKAWLIAIVVILFLIIIIVTAVMLSTSGGGSANSPPHTATPPSSPSSSP